MQTMIIDITIRDALTIIDSEPIKSLDLTSILLNQHLNTHLITYLDT